MSKSGTRRTRRHRRGLSAVLKWGSSAKAKHKSRSGRTGSVRSSQRKGLRK